jgi:hypothetical protein
MKARRHIYSVSNVYSVVYGASVVDGDGLGEGAKARTVYRIDRANKDVNSDGIDDCLDRLAKIE